LSSAAERLAAQLTDVHPLLPPILSGLGLESAVAARNHLACAWPDDSPFRLAGMAEAVTRLRAALRDGEVIAVYGDFDADGVTATALLQQTLEALGGKVLTYVPHREREGYGVHEAALMDLADRGARVVVTVDCGIRAGVELTAARRRGLDVIITDHHALPEDLPDALAVINPRRPDCRYGFSELAGVGLAFKLAQGLLRVHGQVAGRPPLAEESLLDLVAVGTVADVVPLLGENRALVARGLDRLRRAPRPGLAALLAAMAVPPEAVSARDLAFGLGPRLNAAGRMDDADVAIALLGSLDAASAGAPARELEQRNQARRAALDKALTVAFSRVEALPALPSVIVEASEDLPLGVMGLVAGRLMERLYRPCLALRLEGDLARGSARSIPEFDIIAALDGMAEIFIRHGGHARAAGFTLRRADLPALTERLRALADAAIGGRDLRPRLRVAASLPLADMDWSLATALEALEPFGEGNPKPLFWLPRVRLRQVRPVGDGRHLKMLLDNGAGRDPVEAIAFGRGGEPLRSGDDVDLVGSLEIGAWQGRRRLEFKVADLGQREPAATALR
jgi:single-stranded-DNA-specific exonuclease